MYKSVIIILGIVWLMCNMYLVLARIYDYAYKNLALAGSCTASVLLLAFIILYIKKNRK